MQQETQNQPQLSEANTPNPNASSSSFDRQSAVDGEYAVQKATKTAHALVAKRQQPSLTERIATYVPPKADADAIAREQKLELERVEYKRFEQARAFAKLMQASGVPVKYAVERWDTAKLPDGVAPLADAKMERLRERARPGTIVAVIGPRGTGKTHMVCCLVQEFCGSNRSAIYMDAMDYLLSVKSTYGSGKGDEKQVIAELASVELLVLDEMQERGETAWEDRMLTRLINKRYAADKITVLISNQDAATFTERVGESIASRMEEGGGMIACDWAAIREHVGNQKQ